MDIFESFIAAGKHPVSTLERRMALAYTSALEDLESASENYWRYVMNVDNDRKTEYRSVESEKSQKANIAKERLEEVERDIVDFVGVIGDYSRRNVFDMLHRCKLDIANAKRRVRDIKKRALRENPSLNPEDVECLEIVQTAISRRDNIIAELKPFMAELEGILREANKILEKYRWIS